MSEPDIEPPFGRDSLSRRIPNPDFAATALRQKTLLYLHIPKTAGTTLNRIIERQYNPFRIYTIEGRRVEWSLKHFRHLSERRRAALRVVKGHMSFGLHEFVPRPATYITFLRHPVDRAMSAYYFAKGDPLTTFHRRIVREKLDLLSFLNLTPWNNNLQCKAIAGLELSEYRPASIFRRTAQLGAPAPDPNLDRYSNPHTLEVAKANLLQAFSFVGLTERFAESLVLLRRMFGWKLSSYSSYRLSRNRPERDSFDLRVLAEIERRNRFDMELYELGRELFEQAVTRHGIDVVSEAAELAGEQPGRCASIRELASVGLRIVASRAVSLL